MRRPAMLTGLMNIFRSNASAGTRGDQKEGARHDRGVGQAEECSSGAGSKIGGSETVCAKDCVYTRAHVYKGHPHS